MPYGPPVCACCGTLEGMGVHHLYSRKAGYPNDLTVWLCASCHGRTRGQKPKGYRAGSEEHLREAMPTALAARRAKAQKHAELLREAITTIRASGITTATGIAAALTQGDYPAPQGKQTWQVIQVQRLLYHLDAAPAPEVA